MAYYQLDDPQLPPVSQRIREFIPMKTLFARSPNAEPKRPPITPTRRRKLLFSYAPDWVLTIVLATLFFLLDKIDGFKRQFSLEDTSWVVAYAEHERVPNLALIFICFVAPVVLLPIINLLTVRSWWDLHNSWLGLVLGLSLTGAVTQFTKVTVGRPRPDVISRCQPIPGSVDPTYGLSTFNICTQTDEAILRDGFRSFPSGHSSLSFAGLGFLSFYLAGKLHLFDKRGHAGKAWLALTPFSGAALVAISRTMDYRHHWHDVLVGSILGTVLSFFAYRQYYPGLSTELSHRPYSPRIKREEDDVLPVHSHSRDDSVSTELAFRTPSAPPGTGRPARYGYRETAEDTAYYPPDHLENTVPRPNPGSLEEIWEEEPRDGRDSNTPTLITEMERRRRQEMAQQ
ncbi:hypothetical protein EYR36_000948 [Pleurotus pulmonarius]|nr:hypothetical protein EYR36_004433 [Pleurotus pulmonarius]KAF4579138.1 hypothetical protein EYR36_000948 [Pleurotus pulmonarius]KAF4603523.1 hypothetical protein EYR38_003936 [Pleurotus pulmonarius]